MTTKYVNVLIVVPAVLLITAATIATTTASNHRYNNFAFNTVMTNNKKIGLASMAVIVS